MSSTIVECVPNFSEGRDAAVVEMIASAIARGPGVAILDRTMDADHHRSVITFAGSPTYVAAAALRGVVEAIRLIDLNQHSGVHPRLGAADVIPFIPVRGVTMDDCVQIARDVGRSIWRATGVPVYFYEAAATRPERVRLEYVRRGQFEGRRLEVETNPQACPDIGGPKLHPTAGASIVGARKFLIAFNVNLRSHDVFLAKKIALAIRESSGGLPCVKALGLRLPSREQVQVSINLTDFKQTPLHVVLETVRAEAHRLGIEIAGTEIIGLVPRAVLEHAASFYFQCENLKSNLVLENRLADKLSEG